MISLLVCMLTCKLGTVLESGVDEMAGRRFNQDSDIRTGSAAGASGSDRRVIPPPPQEGGDFDDRGRLVCPFHHVVRANGHIRSLTMETPTTIE